MEPLEINGVMTTWRVFESLRSDVDLFVRDAEMQCSLQTQHFSSLDISPDSAEITLTCSVEVSES